MPPRRDHLLMFALRLTNYTCLCIVGAEIITEIRRVSYAIPTLNRNNCVERAQGWNINSRGFSEAPDKRAMCMRRNGICDSKQSNAWLSMIE